MDASPPTWSKLLLLGLTLTSAVCLTVVFFGRNIKGSDFVQTLLTASESQATVLLIRHGEKPYPNAGCQLSPRGQLRAKYILNVFGGSDSRFPEPTDIFSCYNIVAESDTCPSGVITREVDTVVPLAEDLGKPIQIVNECSDVGQLAKLILANVTAAIKQKKPYIALVSWRLIPTVDKALGCSDCPKKWGDSDYDSIWRLDYSMSKDGQLQTNFQADHEYFPKHWKSELLQVQVQETQRLTKASGESLQKMIEQVKKLRHQQEHLLDIVMPVAAKNDEGEK